MTAGRVTADSPRLRAVGGFRGALLGGLTVLALAGCATTADPGPGGPGSVAATSPTTTTASATPTATATTPATPPEASQSTAGTAVPQRPPTDPVRLSIPAMGLEDEELIDLGLAGDGGLEVPEDPDRVGWFTGGGRPGGAGPTVLAGHVDSRTGPAVFFELTSLVVGDEVSVGGADGRTVTYRVTRVQDVPKDTFPTEAVFGATTGDELRLITCTGEWDRAERTHLDNRVVWAVAT